MHGIFIVGVGPGRDYTVEMRASFFMRANSSWEYSSEVTMLFPGGGEGCALLKPPAVGLPETWRAAAEKNHGIANPLIWAKSPLPQKF